MRTAQVCSGRSSRRWRNPRKGFLPLTVATPCRIIRIVGADRQRERTMTAGGLKLYSYWRSSAAYRVRIALNLKGLNYEQIPVHLVRDGGEQHRPEFRAVNPQELVPVLVDGRRVVRQSMAIIEYLDETYDGESKLLPTTARDRARVRALAMVVACDIHPLNNTRVMRFLEHEFGADETARHRWIRHWI